VFSSLGHSNRINKIFGKGTMKNLTKGAIILAVTISLLFVCLAVFAQIMSRGWAMAAAAERTLIPVTAIFHPTMAPIFGSRSA
jgi:hypothetical protein